MRGLAFPPNAPGDREASYEYGTPISNVDVDIPIDPALGGAPIDPALIMGPHPINVVFPNAPQVGVQRDASWSPHPKLHHSLPPLLPQTQPENPYLHQQLHPLDDYQIRQYSQGPQGDPFAPQIPSPYFPIQEQPPPPPQPPRPKRKRKFLREEECSFCQGNEKMNKAGEPENMVTCVECGRSGHPSCMSLETLGEVVRSYPWKCLECKNCEVCQEKGDDARILFCDWCDRGWHMDCVDPPFQDPPEGKWHCPICPPVPLDGHMNPHFPDSQFPDQSQDTQHTPATDREPSIASSSRSVAVADVETPAPPRGKKNRKSTGRKKRAPKHLAMSEGSDNDDAIDVETMTPVVTSTRTRVRGQTTKSAAAKGKARAISPDDAVVPTPTRALKRKRARESSPPPPTKVRLRIPAQRGKKGKEREEDDTPRGMFDDILTPDERSTSMTTPMNADKIMFERSRLIAESKLAPPPPPPPPTASSSRSTRGDTTETPPVHSRPLRSSTLQQQTPKTLDFNFTHLNSPGPSTPGGAGSSSFQAAKFEPGVLRIRTIRFGPYDIKTWYDAPFPEEYASIPDGRLWICEFCLKYMKSRFKAIRHQMKCKSRHPPGDEIYRDGSLSIFEVDGRRNKIYCQNLCLLSKMFLDHKSLFYDVEPFLFYVITLVDDFGARFVGYFSKEKRCPKDYNLSCIMTLPVRQRQGWGNFLIDFSYLLSKIEQRQGSPEKPLSGLGALGYKNYWTLAIMRYLEKAPDKVRLEDISTATSMTVEDVCNTLIQQNMIFIREPTPPIIRPSPGQSIKFPKGRKNGVGRRQLQRLQSSHTPTYDGSSHSPTPKTNGHSNGSHELHDTNKGPFVAPKHYEIRFEREKVEGYLRKWESKGYVRLKPEKLQWTPYLVTRSTQEVPKVDLPAMDTLPVVDEGSKEGEVVTPTTESVVVVVSEPPTEPVTPAATTVAARSGEDLPQEEEKDDVMPMVVDTVIVEERRARTRSAGKEKEPSAPKSRSCSSPPGRSLRTRGAVVEEAMVTRSGRRRPSKEEEEQPGVTPSRPGRKRRRIDSSPEDEEVIETETATAVEEVVVVKWEEDPALLGDSDADGEYELDEPDTEFVM